MFLVKEGSNGQIQKRRMTRGNIIHAKSAIDAKTSALTTNHSAPVVNSRLNGGLIITAADLANAPNMTPTNRATAIIVSVPADDSRRSSLYDVRGDLSSGARETGSRILCAGTFPVALP